MLNMAEMIVGRRQRFWISVAVMASTIMQVLDTTIVNVALPSMQGQLSATPEQMSWVLTSYIVASGIFMPLTGYLTDRFGQLRYLLWSIGGFTLMSVLCGLATSLPEIVLFRILQGVFGAALVPLSQSIMVQCFPVQERGRAMAIWGMGIMVGPILGPTLGGWLTETLSWRWTFFINVPIGIASAYIAWRFVPESARRARKMDWSGFVLLFCAIGGIQMLLDRGSSLGWFTSTEIKYWALMSGVAFIGFVWHSLSKRDDPLFDIRILADRNFTTACALLAIFGLALYGTMMVLPLMMQHLMHYPPTVTGWLMAPRGLASMVSMLVAGRLVSRIDPRMLIIAGVLVFSVGARVTTNYSINISPGWIVLPAIIQGFGLGLMLVPLSTIAFSTLPQKYVSEASGLYSLMRTLGSAIGISVVASLVSRHNQVAWNQLGGGITPHSYEVSHWLMQGGLSLDSPQVAQILGGELARQSTMVAYVDAFIFVQWAFLAMLPLMLIMRKEKRQRPVVDAVK